MPPPRYCANSGSVRLPPRSATDVVDAQLVKFFCRVGTFDANLFTDGVSNEIRANAAANKKRGIVFEVNVLVVLP